ncbi:hypothetical protein [Haladaptatus sp. NG-WS-4]
MSSPPTLQNDRASNFELLIPRTIAQTAVRKLFTPVQFLSFWLAVALPFVYLPLLYHEPLTTGMFGILLVLNLVAVVVGHGYGRD